MCSWNEREGGVLCSKLCFYLCIWSPWTRGGYPVNWVTKGLRRDGNAWKWEELSTLTSLVIQRSGRCGQHLQSSRTLILLICRLYAKLQAHWDHFAPFLCGLTLLLESVGDHLGGVFLWAIGLGLIWIYIPGLQQISSGFINKDVLTKGLLHSFL